MKKILVVEDDKFLANAYRIKLSKAGFEVKIAYDGEEVISTLETFTADLIILDLVMPKKDGFKVLQDLKESEKWRNIPILIASNLGQQEDIDRGMKLGAVGYVIKTDLSLAELITKINSLLKS